MKLEAFRIDRSRRSHFVLAVIGLFVAAILVRLWLAERWAGYYADQQIFIQWWKAADRYGLAEAYARDGSLNYPPFYLLLMQLYGGVLKLFGLVPQAGELSYKALLMVIDLIALGAAVRLTTGMKTAGRLLLLALFALNPALLADGIVWGQVDMLHGLFMVVAVMTAARRPWLSGLLMAAALLTKFQAVTIAPVLGVYVAARAIRTRRWQHAAQWAAAFLAPLAAALAYFGAEGTLRIMLRQAYADAVGKYSSVSMNAMNVWYHLLGVNPSTGDTQQFANLVTYRQLGLILFGLSALLVCAYVVMASGRGDRQVTAVLLRASAAVNMAFFMLPTEIHERYSIPALLFVLFAIIYDRRWLAPAIALTVTVCINLMAVLHTIYGRSGSGRHGGSAGGPGAGPFRWPAGGPIGHFGFLPRMGAGSPLSAQYAWIAAANAVILLALFGLLWADIRASRSSVASHAARMSDF